MSARKTQQWQDEQIRLMDIAAGRDTSLAGKLAKAEAELEEIAAQAKEAYRRYRELDQRQDAKATEIRELRFQIRETTETGEPR